MLTDYFKIRPETPQNIFAPNYELYFAQGSIGPNLSKNLGEYILSIEQDILSQYSSIDKNELDQFQLTDNSIISRYLNYNLLRHGADNESIQKLSAIIKDDITGLLNRLNILSEEIWAACWCTIMEAGEHLDSHVHNSTASGMISGNINIACEDSNTEYYLPFDHNPFRVKNTPGTMTIFPSCVPHATTEHVGREKRISIAFDIQTNLDNISPLYHYRFIKL